MKISDAALTWTALTLLGVPILGLVFSAQYLDASIRVLYLASGLLLGIRIGRLYLADVSVRNPVKPPSSQA